MTQHSNGGPAGFKESSHVDSTTSSHPLYLDRSIPVFSQRIRSSADESCNEPDREESDTYSHEPVQTHKICHTASRGGLLKRRMKWQRPGQAHNCSPDSVRESRLQCDQNPLDSLDSTACRTPTLAMDLKSRVRFSEMVTFLTIPSVASYPVDVKNSIWRSRAEVKLLKKLSQLEFAYDNHDWRTATEEEDMFVDPVSNKLIHPILLLAETKWESKGLLESLRQLGMISS
eukprot:CAMPEP_0183309610 /NCGR_PEP_ID=MMETSP0160_2-20130417/25446_1 /TAXON_ID=2839 ORGANISM="Odontella Sinensis, Strain Grunow 1884" /NCGR_SAMPLE_ID=MMETSP0160_2 /ASSEMBLY_ACC=CAM_ASM_000250 /LENGTH=229 /DNA_ID=CAMNT_0025473665 /DNA_START=119 /DNA_END=808 /DNA_ORIENTATION=-